MAAAARHRAVHAPADNAGPVGHDQILARCTKAIGLVERLVNRPRGLQWGERGGQLFGRVRDPAVGTRSPTMIRLQHGPPDRPEHFLLFGGLARDLDDLVVPLEGAPPLRR